MTKLKIVVIPLMLCILLSACVSHREFKAPELKNEAITHSISAQLVHDNSVFTNSQPVEAWWQSLQDPVLESLVKIGLLNAQDITIAFHNLESARELANLTRLDKYPSITTTLDYQRTRISNLTQLPNQPRSFNLYSGGLQASWQLDLFGRVGQTIEAQQSIANIAFDDYRGAQVMVASELARLYVALRGAQKQLSIARKNAANQQLTLSLTENLSTGGRANSLDVSRALAQYKLTQSRIPDLEDQIESTLDVINTTVGGMPLTMRQSLLIPQNLPNIPASVPVGEIHTLISRRPDVSQSIERAKLATNAYNLNAIEWFPQISLKGSIGFQATTLSDLGGKNMTSMIGPSMSWRILDFARIDNEIASSDALTKAALLDVKKVTLVALQEISIAMRSFNTQRDRNTLLLEATNAASNAAKLAKERFDLGADGLIVVLDAERTLLEAERSLVDSEISVLLSIVDTYTAFAGGWEVTQAN